MNNRWLGEIFRGEIRRILAYRADFWVQYLVNIIAHIGVAFYLWKAVFTANGVTTMQGYSFSGMMLYYLLVPLLGRVIFGSELGAIGREIYDGSLTRYLIYPVNYFLYKIMQYLAHSLIYSIQLVTALLLFVVLFGLPPEITLSAIMILIIPTLFAAAMLNFAITTTLELFAFWADNIWSLLVIVRFSVGLLGGGLIPLAFFPNQAQEILNKLPFVYLTAFPADLLMGRISLSSWCEGMVILSLWTAIFFVLAYKVWKVGIRRYTGVGI